jgi:uncharacterized phage-associated protein
MATAFDVARCFVQLACAGEEPEEGLSNLHLQKLLYYAQGWSLAVFGRPLFASRIEAWKDGPVVPELYHHLKGYGYHDVPPEQVGDPEGLKPTERALVEAVWGAYKCYSAWGLRDRTHREAPWKEARGDLAPDARSDAEITHDAMSAFFVRQAQTELIPGLPPARAYVAAAQLDRGEGRSHGEVFERLRNRR